jgi:hypothetical protein
MSASTLFDRLARRTTSVCGLSGMTDSRYGCYIWKIDCVAGIRSVLIEKVGCSHACLERIRFDPIVIDEVVESRRWRPAKLNIQARRIHPKQRIATDISISVDSSDGPIGSLSTYRPVTGS